MNNEEIIILQKWANALVPSESKPRTKEDHLALNLIDAILDHQQEERYKKLGEKWVPTGYEGYTVSSFGRVRSYWKVTRRKSGPVLESTPRKILRATRNSAGYYQVGLYEKSKRYTLSVHRLVAQAFLGSCPDGMEVCHCDGDRTNNEVENLRYDTTLENQRERWRHKRERERQAGGQLTLLVGP